MMILNFVYHGREPKTNPPLSGGWERYEISSTMQKLLPSLHSTKPACTINRALSPLRLRCLTCLSQAQATCWLICTKNLSFSYNQCAGWRRLTGFASCSTHSGVCHSDFSIMMNTVSSHFLVPSKCISLELLPVMNAIEHTLRSPPLTSSASSFIVERPPISHSARSSRWPRGRWQSR